VRSLTKTVFVGNLGGYVRRDDLKKIWSNTQGERQGARPKRPDRRTLVGTRGGSKPITQRPKSPPRSQEGSGLGFHAVSGTPARTDVHEPTGERDHRQRTPQQNELRGDQGIGLRARVKRGLAARKCQGNHLNLEQDFGVGSDFGS